jgi:putative phage-type endonuclease|tara:strand:+ start:743 stop:1618 length:876 start_codon:yes stop_codon:yes gene_type:complete
MITEEQRKARKKSIGSSDAAAVAGVDKYRTAADVYYEKTGQVEEKELKNDAIEVGTICEGAVLDWFEKDTGLKVKRNLSVVHANKIMTANLDAATEDGQVVEAKTTGVTMPLNKEEWGEVGTDEVPERIIIQCQHQMAVFAAAIAWVPVLMGGVGFRLYQVKRNDDLIKDLEEMEVSFWNDHVLKKVPPEESVPSMDIIKRIRRVPKKTVKLPDELVANWLEAKEVVKLASKTEASAKAEILAALGDAEGGECSSGLITYYSQHRDSYTVKEQDFRVARWKKKKDEVKKER